MSNIIYNETSREQKKIDTTPKMLMTIIRGKFNKAGIIKKASQVSKALQEKSPNNKIEIALRFPEQWRRGKFEQAGVVPWLFTPDEYNDNVVSEPDFYDAFAIFIMQGAPQAGRFGEGNNCFYHCLKQVLPPEHLPWNTPECLRRLLQLKPDDGVHIKHLPIVEEHLKRYTIGVTGDWTYISKKKSVKYANNVIRLKLINGHYEVDRTDRLIIRGITSKPRKPIIYEHIPESRDKTCYDGNKRFVLSDEKFGFINKVKNKSEYILVPKKENLSLEDTYKEFITEADELIKETDGLINLYKTKRHPLAALKLFDIFTLHINVDPIKADEAQFIMNASHGHLYFRKDNYKGTVYYLDYVSHYAAIMASPDTRFPIKRGEFRCYTQEEFEKFKPEQYAIYHCYIEKDKKHEKLFRWNELHYYTGIDIIRAKGLGMKMEIIDDDQANILIYKREHLISGDQLFGRFVNFVFGLKYNKIKGAKEILTSLWGALCQTNIVPLTIEFDSKFKLHEGNQIISACPIDDNKFSIEIVKSGNLFDNNYARIKPFILAYGRDKLSRAIEPHQEYLVRSHTDSMYLTKSISTKRMTELGELDYKGVCDNYSSETKIKDLQFRL